MSASHRGLLLVFALVPALLVAVTGRQLTAAAPVAVAYPAGWSLISGPTGSRIVGASGPLYTFRAGDTSYEAFPTDAALEGCRGYWAYFPAGGSLIAAMTSGATACGVDLPAGARQLIGNPSSAGRAALIGAATALAYGPDGYTAVTSIDVGQGVWVIGPGNLSIEPPAPASLPADMIPCADGTTGPASDTCAGHGGRATPPSGDCFVNVGGRIVHLRC